jgi:large subunit ribosomal protein L17
MAMLRNMATSLFQHEKLVTTDIKAKELRGLADNMITLAKRGDLHARRQALSIIRDKKVVKKVFEEYPERYKNRNGGYSRIIKMGFKRGDGTPTSIVELITAEEAQKGKKKETRGSKSSPKEGTKKGK